MIKGKYKQLYEYFKECQKDEITLTFKMIEKIIKDRLPKSARMYNAFWSNDISHNIALSWLKAGYNSFGLDLLNERISFVRIKTDYIKETTNLII